MAGEVVPDADVQAISGPPQSPRPPEPRNPTPTPTSTPPNDSDHAKLEGLEDPHNWSDTKRWLTVTLVSLVGFISPLGSSITVAGSKSLEETMNLGNRLLATLPVSVYVLGMSVHCRPPHSSIRYL